MSIRTSVDGRSKSRGFCEHDVVEVDLGAAERQGALVDAGQEQQILDHPLESEVLREHDFGKFLDV